MKALSHIAIYRNKYVDRNKIQSQITKVRTTLLSQTVVKYSKMTSLVLYFEGPKEGTISLENNIKSHNRRTHNLGKRTWFRIHWPFLSKFQISTNHWKTHSIFLRYVDNNINVTKLVTISCDGRIFNAVFKGGVIRNTELNMKRSLEWFVCLSNANEFPLRHISRMWMELSLYAEASLEKIENCWLDMRSYLQFNSYQ